MGAHARGVMRPSCSHAAIAAGKARRLEQAAHKPISWLASMAQAAACCLGGRSARGEETAAEANAGMAARAVDAPRHCVGGGQCSGGAAGHSRAAHRRAQKQSHANDDDDRSNPCQEPARVGSYIICFLKL